MIACYAWTNLMIINIINTKVNHFAQEEADLFIHYTNTISYELVQSVKKSGVFNKVYFIDQPRIDNKKLFLGMIPNVRMLFRGRALKNYYYRTLNGMVEDKKYNIILATGFWNNTVFLIDYFYKRCPSLKVFFVEEGSINYDHTKTQLCTCYPIRNKKEKIKYYINQGRLILKYIKLVDNNMFLYSPERYMIDSNVVPVKIPKINWENTISQNVLRDSLSQIDKTHYIWYDKRSVYFFADYIDENEQYKLLDIILETVLHKHIIIKTHTSSTQHKIDFAKKIENEQKVFVDRNTYLFEGMYFHIDIQNKIFITRGSSTVMNCKVMFGKEPYVILTYKLYQEYHQNGNEIYDQYRKDLEAVYSDRTRVMVPNSVAEFREMLAETYRSLKCAAN